MSKKDKLELNWDREIMEKCPILYRMRNASMMETCMCWGFSCNEGWKDPLWKASCALEALNMQYWPKYKVRIQAAQLKEKFGTLRFYYDIVKDGAWYKRIPHDFFEKIYRKLQRVNYKYKQVQDVAPFTEHIVEELKTKEAYVREKHSAEHISNVRVEEKDGKWFKYTDLENYGKWHHEPTKHKMLYRLKDFIWKLVIKLDSYGEEWSAEQQVISKLMQDRADEIIRQAEDECYDKCEDCGADIGKNGYRKRCETAGWIRYICEDCAKKHKGSYYMEGAYYEDGKLVKTKEELDKEKVEIDAKWKAREDQNKAEDAEFEKELAAAREEDIKAGRTIEHITTEILNSESM